MYFIIHELTFQFYSLIYIYSIINIAFSLIVVSGSPPPSTADDSMWRMDPRIRPYVIHVGFYGIYRLGHIMIDWSLITCLVERWRPETHTFHVPVREMTITLQDVAIILGLRIDGPAITGTCVLDVAELCGEMLGVTLPADALRGSAISIRWLYQQLSTPRLDADEVDFERSARGFILALMGSFLFTDKKGV